VATECEDVLAPAGWTAVQVSPPQEHGLAPPGYPWYQRYQAVSYTLNSRSGDEAAFEDMVRRCEAVGVDIYVDAILNHMAFSDGTGSGGTAYTKYSYPGLYQSQDFHTPCAVDDYSDAADVQDCELFGLADLNTGKADVRERIAGYLIELGRMGVAGFRVDAAKHIQPVELDSILGLVNRAAVDDGRALPYVFGEVIDYGGVEAVHADDYYGLGYASGGASDLTEFRFRGAGEKFAGVNGQRLADLANFPDAWGLIPADKAVVFIQNHDTQRDAGSPVVDYDAGDRYRLANVWMLAQPYGYPKVMSGYAFRLGQANDRDLGPPSDAGGNTRPVSCPARLEDAGGGGWVCEHRDPVISTMVRFRRAVAGTPRTAWWDNGANAIAFSRGELGFVALSLESETVSADVPTTVPPGTYCDILTGGRAEGACKGRVVEVSGDGFVHLELAPGEGVAVHVGSRL
jgi:alpha-amylase